MQEIRLLDTGGSGKAERHSGLLPYTELSEFGVIRPKIMTICAILFGLLPIMWSPTNQSGADVMKRIAAPMIGGVITSGILELLIYPVIYVVWRGRNLRDGGWGGGLNTEGSGQGPPGRRARGGMAFAAGETE